MSIRKIKNAKDLSTNELIYFKSHAQATFMNNGLNVEEVITNLENSQNSAKEEILNNIAEKQDIISDLDTIRQGAAKGATALQSYTEQYKGTVTGVKINGETKNPSSGVVDLGTVITAHQDISGKQDKLVSGTNIKTINGESIVGSGDLTIEGGAKIYTWSPTITSIEDTKISGTFTEEEYYNILNADVLYINVDGESIFCIARGINSENGEGIRITGSQITTYADFAIDISVIKEDGVFTGTISEPIPSKTSQLENDSNFISSDGLKTINGESIIGSGDITISGGSVDTSDCVKVVIGNIPHMPDADGIVDLSADFARQINVNGLVYTSTSKGLIDLGYINKQLSTSTSSSMTLSPNIYYRNTSTSLSTLTITLGSVSNSKIINEYFVEFTTSSSGTTVSLPSTIKWANGETPTFEAGTTYQISIVNNLGVVTKFK